jgi:hypothetical protein
MKAMAREAADRDPRQIRHSSRTTLVVLACPDLPTPGPKGIIRMEPVGSGKAARKSYAFPTLRRGKIAP